MKCTHPHVFRLSTKDAYHCLACGEAIRVIPYSDIAEGSTLTQIRIKVPQPRAKDGDA